ncbi:MAG: 3-hydroxyacyl-CoA dehydrogenase NAD-binding domain-containing protein [Pseudomonadota bacterium]
MADAERLPVAIVGCGVIGAGWAARFVLAGHEVRISDPAPNAPQIVERALHNARHAWDELGMRDAPEGRVRFCDSIAAAVEGARFVQESVPERIELKASVYADIEAASDADTIIASSTSGIRPTNLQAELSHPQRLVVGHPYNPVYLLPVVEVVGGEATAADSIAHAQAVYANAGMRPVHVRVEIDAFIGDRLLEAVWREALWLINDGVATTEEIDTVITHGFGLRWAQMGLFETYRVAGGEGGFKHFLEQFGPTLEWPWTKLMDTPEFTPELIDTIVRQSDAQSGEYSIAELEQQRDRNLIGFLRVLQHNNWGAGSS